jgi:hypothetical protein
VPLEAAGEWPDPHYVALTLRKHLFVHSQYHASV